jgi:WD40 repeat protein/serine/threonine protein kinase
MPLGHSDSESQVPEEKKSSTTPPSSSRWTPLAHGPPVIPDHDAIKLIGRGSYGEVWLARNVMGSLRAVKIIYRDAFDEEKPYEREFEGIRKFEPVSRTHPSQVSVLHVGRGVGSFYYVMELADDVGGAAADSGLINIDNYSARTLKSETHRRGLLPVAECIELGLALTTALAHLHQNGLVHRDIKPSNIIYVNGLPKLADIGLVCGFDATQSFVGTLGFAAPEWPGTPQADIYSLGKVLYEAATGRDRQDFPELPSRISGTTEQQDGLMEFNEVLLKACEPNPRNRYQSADEMHEDLLLLRSGESLVRLRNAERRFARLKRTSAVIALLAVLTVVGWLFASQRARELKALVKENSDLAARSQLAEKRSRESLVTMQLSRGMEAMRKEDLGQALSWFSVALPNVQDDRRAGKMHRIRINSILENHPRLTSMFLQQGRVRQCGFTPDNQRLISITAENELKVYDLAANRLEFGIKGSYAHGIYDDYYRYSPVLRFSNDGNRVVIRRLMPGGVTEIFDLEKRRLLALPGLEFSDSDHILDCLDGENVLALKGETNAITINISSGAACSPTFQTPGRIVSGRLSEDGRLVALVYRLLASPKRPNVGHVYIQLFDFQTAQKIGSAVNVSNFKDDREAAFAFFLMDKAPELVLIRHLWTGSSCPIEWCDPRTGQIAQTGDVLEAKDPYSILKGGQWILATAVAGGSRKLINLETGEQVKIDFNQEVLALSFSEDGLFAATMGLDKPVRIWNRKTGELALPVLNTRLQGYALAFSPNSELIAAGSEDGSIRVWDLVTTSRPRLVIRQPYPDSRAEMDFSSSGRFIATVSEGWSARVWDAKTGMPASPPLAELFGIRGITFSPDERFLISAPRNGWKNGDGEALKLWKFGCSRTNISILDTPPSKVICAKFSTDSKRILTVSNDGGSNNLARVWDTESGKLLVSVYHKHHIVDAAFSPDGEKFVTIEDDSPAKIWNSRTGQLLREFQNTNQTVGSIAFTPDQRFLAVGGIAGGAHVYDLHDLTHPFDHVTLFHGGGFVDVKYNERYSNFITFGATGADIWEWHQLTPMARRLNLEGCVEFTDISRDGDFLLTSGKGVHLWDALTGSGLLVAPRFGDPGSIGRLNPSTPEYSYECDRAYRLCSWKPCDYSMEEISDFATLYSGMKTAQGGEFNTLLASNHFAIWQTLRTSHPDAFKTTDNERLLWHERLSYLAEKQEGWTAALFHLDQALALNAPLGRGVFACEIYFRRGMIKGKLGQFASATEDFRQSVRLDPDRVVAWECQMASVLAQNLTNDYAILCREAYDHFSWVTNISTANGDDLRQYLGWFAARSPGGVTNYDLPLKCAEIRPWDSSRSLSAIKGTLLYRAGRFRDAVEVLENSVKSFDYDEHSSAEQEFPLAMSYFKTGMKDEAVAAYTRGCSRIEERSFKGSRNYSWQQHVFDNALRREAESVMGLADFQPAAN